MLLLLKLNNNNNNMILTDKCKNDFIDYINEKHFSFSYETQGTCEYLWLGNDIDLTLESPCLLNALIIEFFESIKASGFKSLWSYCFGNSYDPFNDDWDEYTTKAIIHANKIYNETKV